MLVRIKGLRSKDLPTDHLTPAAAVQANTSSQATVIRAGHGDTSTASPEMLAAHNRAHGLAVHAYMRREKATCISPSDEPDQFGEDASTTPLIGIPIRQNPLKTVLTVVGITLLALLWLTGRCSLPIRVSYPANIAPAESAQVYARGLTSSLLEVFQIYPPVLTVAPGGGALELTDGSSNASVEIVDADRSTCQEVLVVHSFAFSYGQPFIGNYTPPQCKFNRVTWNLTVVSAGRQFDRLGIVYLGDIEVFRTSTAEPTANGIDWTYLKVSLPGDRSCFVPLTLART